MNISNTAIIKSESPYSAIQEAIKCFFNEPAAQDYLDSIKLVDGVAECVKVEKSDSGMVYTTTSYFIPTIINAKLIRVEHCCNAEVDWS